MSGRLDEPVRTCIGCRERAGRSSLVRFVAIRSEGPGESRWVITADPGQSLPGRGAHLHPDARCLDQAKRRRAFGRALRVEGPVDLNQVEALAEGWSKDT